MFVSFSARRNTPYKKCQKWDLRLVLFLSISNDTFNVMRRSKFFPKLVNLRKIGKRHGKLPNFFFTAMDMFGGHLILVINNRARVITSNSMLVFTIHYILKFLDITILFHLIFRLRLFSSSETNWLGYKHWEGGIDVW